jgi:recombination protein RecT
MSSLKEKLQKQEDKGQVLQIKPAYALKQLMIKMKKEIQSELGDDIDIEKFQEGVLSLFNSKIELQDCEALSFISSLIKCSKLGFDLENKFEQYYITPCNLDNCNKAKLHISYKGLVELSHKDEKLKTLYSNEVRENDEFDIDYGLEQKLTHKPLLKGDRGDVIGYYGVYHLEPYGHDFVFITKDEISNYSKTYYNDFERELWENHFDSMAKKIVIKNLLKDAPLSRNMQNLINFDESISNVINN